MRTKVVCDGKDVLATSLNTYDSNTPFMSFRHFQIRRCTSVLNAPLKHRKGHRNAMTKDQDGDNSFYRCTAWHISFASRKPPEFCLEKTEFRARFDK